MNPTKLQTYIFNRDNGTCLLCPNPAFGPPHHITPKGRGGKDVPENMGMLCEKCHHNFHFGNDKGKQALLEALISNGLNKVVEFYLLGVVAGKER